MIGTLDIKVAAHNPNFPLEPVFTFINSAQSFRIRNVPRAIGKWNITKVFIHLNYPDNTTIQKECVLNGNIWIGTVEGCATSGTSTNGFYVTASGIDENENVITNYVLGAGDLYVKDLDGTIDPERVGTKMYFNDTIPTNPKKGDATFIDGVLNVYDGTNWVPVAVSPDPSYIQDAYGNKICADRTVEVVEQGGQTISDELALKSDLPTKTSDLTNDSGFVTTEEVKPLYEYDTSTGTVKPTEMASYAVILAATYKTNHNADKYAEVQSLVEFDPVELTPKFTLMGNYLGYYPWKLSKFFDQTYSPELELVWWYGKICRVRGGMFIQSYTGFMWRTKGIGFAIPCDQNGIPDGRLYEITQIEQTSPYRICFNNATQIHTITGNENWSAILTIDEQENQITCTRSKVQRAKENRQTFPTLDDIPTSTSQLTNDSGYITSADVPTKTSDLTNDSGFITSADIITKRDLNDMTVKGVPRNTNTQSWFTIKYGTTTENAWYYDEGRWESGQTLRVLAASATIYTLQKNQEGQWTNIGEFQLDNNAEATVTYDGVTYSITGYVGEIVTSNQLASQIAALEARIAALENNNQ